MKIDSKIRWRDDVGAYMVSITIEEGESEIFSFAKLAELENIPDVFKWAIEERQSGYKKTHKNRA